MSQRSLDDYAHERQVLDAAHAQNETGRDSFVALGHTALFAASVSFVGDVTPLAEATCKPLLIAGWSADVIGLLALTLSFGAARRSIDARRAALNEIVPPVIRLAELPNGIALWSFPVALLCLFSFVTANVVYANDRPTSPPDAITRRVWSGAAAKSAQLRDSGGSSAAKSAQPRRATDPVDWCHPRTAGAGSPTPCIAARTKEMTAVGAH